MNNNFAVVLKDGNYIAVTPDQSLVLDTYEKRMEFVISELRQVKIGEHLIDSIDELNVVEKNPNLNLIKWFKNDFLIFLKNQSYITIEAESYKPMTLEEKMEFSINHLKSTGINPDNFDHIGDPLELQSKTNIMLISWILIAVVFAAAFFILF